MKTEKSRPALGMKKVDFMQASSFNFLEHEKVCNVIQRGGVLHNHQADECDSTILPGKHNGSHIIHEVATKTDQTIQPENGHMCMSKEERKEISGSCAPKRYVTKCYFQPKQDPVSYSETVIVNIGSTKKQYFETIMYQTKLVPFRWTETMTTYTPYIAEKNHKADHQAFVQKPEFHYISLEPQQVAATEKITKPQEIAV